MPILLEDPGPWTLFEVDVRLLIGLKPIELESSEMSLHLQVSWNSTQPNPSSSQGRYGEMAQLSV
jgi:hypothetical protein